jgi:hypothetical protein
MSSTLARSMACRSSAAWVGSGASRTTCRCAADRARAISMAGPSCSSATGLRGPSATRSGSKPRQRSRRSPVLVVSPTIIKTERKGN